MEIPYPAGISTDAGFSDCLSYDGGSLKKIKKGIDK